MRISTKDWLNYINKMRKLNDTAADLMQEYVRKNGFSDTEAIINYAYALTTKYGEGAAELAAEMYEAIAEAQGAIVPPAVPAPTSSYGDIAKAINGSLLQSPDGKKLTQVVGRHVKLPGADTMLKNAIRDGAEFAWVPFGDTCAFCITLASRGWQKISKKALKKGHAEHIHANCDCQYCVRFDGKSNVDGYELEKYREMYDVAEGKTPQEKIKSLRKNLEDREKINAQKRINYTQKKSERIASPYNTKPGVGQLIFLNNETKDGVSDRKTATWLHKTFGGDITCLPETAQEGKNPDAKWNGDFWEFKAPTTKTAIDDRIRKAKKQIIEAQTRNGTLGNRCGVVIDISGANMPENEAIETILLRSQQRLPNNTDVIIKNGNSIVGCYRIKK